MSIEELACSRQTPAGLAHLRGMPLLLLLLKLSGRRGPANLKKVLEAPAPFQGMLSLECLLRLDQCRVGVFAGDAADDSAAEHSWDADWQGLRP